MPEINSCRGSFTCLFQNSEKRLLRFDSVFFFSWSDTPSQSMWLDATGRNPSAPGLLFSDDCRVSLCLTLLPNAMSTARPKIYIHIDEPVWCLNFNQDPTWILICLSGLGRVVEYVSEWKIHLALRETQWWPNPGSSILIFPITHKHDIYWKKTFIAGTWLLITGVSQEERHCWLKMRRTMIQRLKYERSETDQLLYTFSHAKNYSV